MRIRPVIRELSVVFIIAALCFCITAVSVSAESGTAVKIKVGNKSFNGVFYDNDTANELLKSMPMKLKMSELNGNEKYRYLSKDFPTNEKRVKRIKAGDIMLYGSDCLVVFYKSFNTSYKYTKVGRITNPKGLKKAAGKKSVKVSFSKKKVIQPIEKKLTMKIGAKNATVDWENNESVAALRDLVSEKPLTIQMSMYGGFEQVGPVGTSLPGNDVQTTTSAGDIVLYSGNQIVVFYGSNSWAYTRLGHITDQDAAGMTDLLSNGAVTITISMENNSTFINRD